MTRASRFLAFTLLVAGAALPLSAQKSPLNIKPGLWEIAVTLTGEESGNAFEKVCRFTVAA